MDVNVKEVAERVRGSALANGGLDDQDAYTATIDSILDDLTSESGARSYYDLPRALTRSEIATIRTILF